MAELYLYKCNKCGFGIHASKDGSYPLFTGPGHFFICPSCKYIFTRNWTSKEIDLAKLDYSFEKDGYLSDLLANACSDECKEEFKRDMLWFQHEVVKGADSKYYGNTAMHQAVEWAKSLFGDKLFIFLQRKEYAKQIKIDQLKDIVKDPFFEKVAVYKNLLKQSVRCVKCNEIALSWSSPNGCPECGGILELESNSLILVD